MEALVTITGYAGGVAEVRATTNNRMVASFRLACTPRFRRADGSWDDRPTTWLPVQAWGVLAENLAGSIKKGDAVIVQGRLRTEQWTDSEQVPRERLVLEATTVGHDLTKGAATFRKTVRSAPGEDELTEVSGDAGSVEGGLDATQTKVVAA